MVRVQLVTSIRILPCQSVQAQIKVDSTSAVSGPLLWHYTCEPGEELGVSGEDALIHPREGLSYVFRPKLLGIPDTWKEVKSWAKLLLSQL